MAGETRNIIVFGDSICFGQLVSPHLSWVTRLSSFLSVFAKALGQTVLLSNVSVNGCTSRQALERMPFDVQSHSPDIVLIQFGLNDCNTWQTDNGLPRVSQKAYEANLHEMVDRAIAFGARKTIFLTNHPVTKVVSSRAKDGISYADRVLVYNDIVRAVAEARVSDSARLLDMEQKIMAAVCGHNKSVSTFLNSDGLHLNEIGHDAYFLAAKEIFEQEWV